MEIAEEAVECSECSIWIFCLRDVVYEARRQLGEMGLRGVSFESARMPGKPAPHGPRHHDGVAEAHLGELRQRFAGVGVARKRKAAAFGGGERGVLEQACVTPFHCPQMLEQDLRQRIAVVVAEE